MVALERNASRIVARAKGVRNRLGEESRVDVGIEAIGLDQRLDKQFPVAKALGNNQAARIRATTASCRSSPLAVAASQFRMRATTASTSKVSG